MQMTHSNSFDTSSSLPRAPAEASSFSRPSEGLGEDMEGHSILPRKQSLSGEESQFSRNSPLAGKDTQELSQYREVDARENLGETRAHGKEEAVD